MSSTEVSESTLDATPLARDFPEVGHEAWQVLAAKVVNRSRPDDRRLDPVQAEQSLRTTTVDGLVIDPLYHRPGHPVRIGHPGVAPFARGSSPTRPPVWDIRPFHDDPDTDTARRDIADDLAGGATSLWLGLGPKCLPYDELDDVLADVDLARVPVCVSSCDDDAGAAVALEAVWRARGVDAASVRGSLGIDPLGHAASEGAKVDLLPLLHWARACRDRYPGIRPIEVDARMWYDGGGGDVEELGGAIATAVAYLRALEADGIDARTAFRMMEFRVSATSDQFLTIARLRALRILWARIGEVAGVPEAERGARQNAVTSWRMLTRDDPWVNILRATVSTFAAAVGGAESITVLPYDSIAGLPIASARRIARNTQVILAEESHAGQVIDPAGGSWYVESLTHDLARRAWAWFQEIEAHGGMEACLTSGFVQEHLDGVAALRDVALAKRRLPLTGVSMFPKPDEPSLERQSRKYQKGWRSETSALQTVHDQEAGRAGRDAGMRPPDIRPLRLRRDAQVFETLRDRAAAHRRATGQAPTVLLAAVGGRRDFGAREAFARNFLAVAGIEATLVEGTDPAVFAQAAAGHAVAVVCSSPRLNAVHGVAVADALHAAGVTRVFLAGRAIELGGDGESEHVDDVIYDGLDIVAVLNDILDRLGVPA